MCVCVCARERALSLSLALSPSFPPFLCISRYSLFLSLGTSSSIAASASTNLPECLHALHNMSIITHTHTTRAQTRALKYLACASRNSTCLHWVVKGCVFNKPTSTANYTEIAKLLISIRRTLLLAKDSNERQNTHTQYIYI